MKNKESASGKVNIKLNRRIITFIICIVVSFFFWLMMAFGKEYTIQVNFPVQYINFPSDKVISNHLPEYIDIQIKSNGFNLLIYKFKNRGETILVDVNDMKSLNLKNHYYLLTNSRIDKITSQFNNNIEVLSVFPDTIFLNFNKKETKRVPVKANISISFQKENQQIDSIILTPATIDISGSEEIISKINKVETEPITLKDVTKSVSLKLNILKTKELKFVDLSQSSVQATANITKITEASIDLPITPENVPSGYILKTFPDKVSIKYNVTFSNYEKINIAEFMATVDYKKSESGNNRLKVLLTKHPFGISSIKINPEKVEFILKK